MIARLSRRTTSGRFIPVVDGMRFVSIALVVMSHIDLTTVGIYYGGPKNMPSFGYANAGPLVTWLDRGWVGVYVFFVISGFVLALPFARHSLSEEPKVDLSRYYLRRLTRLEPPYLVALALTLLAVVALGESTLRASLPHYLADVPYLHSIRYGGVLGVFWTLEIEVQFYLVVPLLARVFSLRNRATRRLVILVVVLGCSGLTHIWQGSPKFLLTLPFFLQYFLAGFLLADIYVSNWKERPASQAAWDLAGVSGWIAVFALIWTAPGARAMSLPAALLLPMALMVVFVAAFRGRATPSLLSNRWIYTIGGMCYSMYLLHPIAMMLSRHIQLALNNPLTIFDGYVADLTIQMLIGIPLVLGLTVLFFVWVERPCMNPAWPKDLAAWMRSKRRAGI